MKNTRGFTLVEVLVCIAILGVLAGLAAPSFSESIKRYRITAIKDDLIASLQAARFEAIRRGQTITLIRTTGCGAEAGDINMWSCGWFSVVGTITDGRDANSAEQNVAVQTATVAKGYDVSHTGGGRKIVYNRWGNPGAGHKFVITNNSDGVAGASTTTVCITSGGRARSALGDASC